MPSREGKVLIARIGSPLCFMTGAAVLLLSQNPHKSEQIVGLTVGIGLICSSIVLGIYAYCFPPTHVTIPQANSVALLNDKTPLVFREP